MPRYNPDQAIEQMRKADRKGFEAFYSTMQALVKEHGASTVEWVLEHIQRCEEDEGFAALSQTR